MPLRVQSHLPELCGRLHEEIDQGGAVSCECSDIFEHFVKQLLGTTGDFVVRWTAVCPPV